MNVFYHGREERAPGLNCNPETSAAGGKICPQFRKIVALRSIDTPQGPAYHALQNPYCPGENPVKLLFRVVEAHRACEATATPVAHDYHVTR